MKQNILRDSDCLSDVLLPEISKREKEALEERKGPLLNQLFSEAITFMDVIEVRTLTHVLS